MHTKILVLVVAVSVLLLGCGPGKKGCQWWDTDCPDSPYGDTSTASTSTNTDLAACLEECNSDPDCEAECVDTGP